MAKKQTESLAEERLAEPTPKAKRHSSFKAAAEAAEAAEAKAAAPKKAAPSATSRADLSKLTTDGDLVDIWERRILNPDHRESPTIRIKTPGMKLRWINLQNRGRFQRARYEQGWVPVQQGELMDEREIYGASFTSEGFVCRGEKQSEMLMKIPLAVFKQIQKKRAAANTASYKKLKDSMGSAGFNHFKEKYGGSAGDQAAEAASNFVGDVKFGTEKVSSDELYE